ncbi:MAG: hypothetical protein IIZ07_04700, partial [Ruminococcus sp.]|nr:hypothetical protein [Ruminococcus sp.]
PKLLAMRSLLKFRSSLFKGLQIPKAEPLVAVVPPAKHLSVQPFARGEFPNSPVDCLGRGDALRDERPLKNKVRVYKNSD